VLQRGAVMLWGHTVTFASSDGADIAPAVRGCVSCRGLGFFLCAESKAMQWTAAEWASFLTASGAALVLLVKTCFSGMSESRCEQIRCLGCCSVTRKVKKEEDERQDDDTQLQP
jgi:hypothetical protein